jgi:hypothetical protein
LHGVWHGPLDDAVNRVWHAYFFRYADLNRNVNSSLDNSRDGVRHGYLDNLVHWVWNRPVHDTLDGVRHLNGYLHGDIIRCINPALYDTLHGVRYWSVNDLLYFNWHGYLHDLLHRVWNRTLDDLLYRVWYSDLLTYATFDGYRYGYWAVDRHVNGYWDINLSHLRDGVRSWYFTNNFIRYWNLHGVRDVDGTWHFHDLLDQALHWVRNALLNELFNGDGYSSFYDLFYWDGNLNRVRNGYVHRVGLLPVNDALYRNRYARVDHPLHDLRHWNIHNAVNDGSRLYNLGGASLDDSGCAPHANWWSTNNSASNGAGSLYDR